MKKFSVTCNCGEHYDADQWADLVHIGTKYGREWRNCSVCKSTLVAPTSEPIFLHDWGKMTVKERSLREHLRAEECHMPLDGMIRRISQRSGSRVEVVPGPAGSWAVWSHRFNRCELLSPCIWYPTAQEALTAALTALVAEAG